MQAIHGFEKKSKGNIARPHPNLKNIALVPIGAKVNLKMKSPIAIYSGQVKALNPIKTIKTTAAIASRIIASRGEPCDGSCYQYSPFQLCDYCAHESILSVDELHEMDREHEGEDFETMERKRQYKKDSQRFQIELDQDEHKPEPVASVAATMITRQPLRGSSLPGATRIGKLEKTANTRMRMGMSMEDTNEDTGFRLGLGLGLNVGLNASSAVASAVPTSRTLDEKHQLRLYPLGTITKPEFKKENQITLAPALPPPSGKAVLIADEVQQIIDSKKNTKLEQGNPQT